MSNKKDTYEIHPIKALKDNIIWIWTIRNKAIVIDPSESRQVNQWLKKRNMELISILQTHHHEDHIGGTKQLLKDWPKVSIIASKDDIDRIPFQTISVIDKQEFSIEGYKIKVLYVPGHTKHHLAYFLPGNKSKRYKPALFCGDTLFAGGCGRLLEGSAQEMYYSLKRFASLPKETYVYSAHEYTKGNLEWAISIEPENKLIRSRLEGIDKIINTQGTSLPSTIEEEEKTNLFLRSKDLKVFTMLRENKDNWK